MWSQPCSVLQQYDLGMRKLHTAWPVFQCRFRRYCHPSCSIGTNNDFNIGRNSIRDSIASNRDGHCCHKLATGNPANERHSSRTYAHSQHTNRCQHLANYIYQFNHPVSLACDNQHDLQQPIQSKHDNQYDLHHPVQSKHNNQHNNQHDIQQPVYPQHNNQYTDRCHRFANHNSKLNNTTAFATGSEHNLWKTSRRHDYHHRLDNSGRHGWTIYRHRLSSRRDFWQHDDDNATRHDCHGRLYDNYDISSIDDDPSHAQRSTKCYLDHVFDGCHHDTRANSRDSWPADFSQHHVDYVCRLSDVANRNLFKSHNYGDFGHNSGVDSSANANNFDHHPCTEHHSPHDGDRIHDHHQRSNVPGANHPDDTDIFFKPSFNENTAYNFKFASVSVSQHAAHNDNFAGFSVNQHVAHNDKSDEFPIEHYIAYDCYRNPDHYIWSDRGCIHAADAI